MARWAVVVEENMANGIWSPRVLAEIEGTREDAVAELRRIVPEYTPTHPMSARQRTLYRDGDRYLLVSRGALHTYHCVFRVWEMLSDSKRPEIQAARPAEDTQS